MTNLFALLVAFQVKHFLADYVLQGKFMLGKFKADWSFVLPLLSHCSVQGAFTLGICLVVCPRLWWLALVDVAAHFVMDRIKAGPKYLGRFKSLSGEEFVKIEQDMKETNRCLVEYSYDLNEPYAITLDRQLQANKKRVRGNTYFWIALGGDQLFHHLTDLFIVWMLVS